MSKEEWLARELAKMPARGDVWRANVMKTWGLKPVTQ
jgi:hypothetical protein